MAQNWDQSKFDRMLEEHLKRHSSDTWPASLNKKAFFIALKARELSPRVSADLIKSGLERQISAKRKDGTSGSAPIGFVIAARRASKHWTASAQFQKAQKSRLAGRSVSELKAWRSLIKKKYSSIMRGRRSSKGFIAVGWVAVLEILGRMIGGRYDRGRGGDGKRGSNKGKASPAKPNRLQVMIEDTAQSKSAKSGSLIKFGQPALQAAFDFEVAKWMKELDEDMKPETDKFNRSQH